MKLRPALHHTGFVAIDRPVQLRALASPVRQEVLDVLDAAGPCPIAELGERLGRAPDSLYFHIRRLVKVGLVVEIERRKVGRHVFVVYDLAGRPMWIDRSKAHRKDLQGVVNGVLRLAARDYRRGFSDPAPVVEGPGRNHWGARVRGWLDQSSLGRANKLLDQLSDLFRAGRPGPGCQPLALAWVLAPAPSRRGASSSKSAQAGRRGSGQPSRASPRKSPRGRRSAKGNRTW